MRKIFIICGLTLATSAWGETCGLQEYNNNATCTIIDTGFYGVNCTESPAGYTELEYLENADTNSAIDTGVLAAGNLTMELTFEWTKQPDTSPRSIILAGDGTAYSNSFGISSQLGITYVYYNKIYITDHKYTVNEKHILTQDRGTLYYDGTQISTTPAVEFQGTRTLILFQTHYTLNATSYPANAGLRVYRLRIWENDILVRDMIPAQNNSDLALGLYDLVNNVFHTSMKQSTLIPGPPSDCEYQLQCTPGFYCTNGIHVNCKNTLPYNSIYVGYGGTNVNCPTNKLCTAGATKLRTNTGVNVPLFAARNTTPAINIKINDQICYADLVSGKSADAINIKYDYQIYHTVK